MSKPKPNTMDDWIDPYFHKYLSPTLIPTGHLSISEEHLEIIKASMHTKLQEVDRAAREWELNWITGLNPKHPDFTKIVKDRLASLKGGDV